MYPGLVVNEISPDDEILVDVLITADTTNASQNLANAKDDSCNTFTTFGYSCEAKSKYFWDSLKLKFLLSLEMRSSRPRQQTDQLYLQARPRQR